MFKRIYEVVKHEPRLAIHIEKLPSTALVGWDGDSWDILGEANNINQVEEVSDMAPKPAMGLFWEGSEKG